MGELKYTEFVPAWMKEADKADRILYDTPAVGSLAEVSPRIVARLRPRGGSHEVSALALVETLTCMQSLARFAGRDECHGINPDFADLRSLPGDVVSLSRLAVEPPEEGSFVIPARLRAAPLACKGPEDAEPRLVTAEAVARRFHEILSSVGSQDTAARVSIGAIQAVEALRSVLRREADAVEFASFDSLGQPAKEQPVRVDAAFIRRVERVRQSRRHTEAKLEALEGVLTAIDLVEQKLTVRHAITGELVKGTFPPIFQPTLVRCLGGRVRLQGVVERRGDRVLSINADSVEVPDEE